MRLPLALALVCAACSSPARAPRELPAPAPAPEPPRPLEVELRAPAPPRADAPLDLRAAIERALADSPSLEEARARVDAARAAVDQDRATRWPTLDLGFDVARTDNPVQAFMAQLNAGEFELTGDLNHPDDTSQSRLSATLAWNVWDGGARSARQGASELDHESAELERAGAARELSARVAATWLSAQEAASRRDVVDARERFLERALASARARREEGAGLRSDELSIDARLAAMREERARIDADRGLALEGLRRLIGAREDEPLALAPLDRVDPIAEPAWESDDAQRAALETAYAAREELRASELAIRAAERREDEARATDGPRLDLVAGGFLDGSTPLLELDAESYLVGARLSWRAFEGFGSDARVRAARAARRAASATRDELRLSIASETRSAFLRLDAARARRAASEVQERSADEALRLVREEHDAGAADVERLLSAEAELAAARARLASARFDEARALVELRRAVGLGPLEALADARDEGSDGS